LRGEEGDGEGVLVVGNHEGGLPGEGEGEGADAGEHVDDRFVRGGEGSDALALGGEAGE